MLRAPQLYTFLQHCESTSLTREVLECGAGGWPGFEPLLARFAERGFVVHGIEISEKRLDHARVYCADHGIDADLRVGDMRELPYPDGSIPFLFSYNAIFHMPKADIARALEEIKRVLAPGGHCFVNFASIDDQRCGEGEELGPGEFQQREGDEVVLHSFYDADEADPLFDGLVIDHKERRVLTRRFQDGLFRQGYIDYIARVPDEEIPEL